MLSFVIILARCEFFTNGVEWVGGSTRRRGASAASWRPLALPCWRRSSHTEIKMSGLMLGGALYPIFFVLVLLSV